MPVCVAFFAFWALWECVDGLPCEAILLPLGIFCCRRFISYAFVLMNRLLLPFDHTYRT